MFVCRFGVEVRFEMLVFKLNLNVKEQKGL